MELGKRGRFSKVSIQARSSGGERYLDTVEVVGSNPIVPTMIIKGLWAAGLVSPFLVFILLWFWVVSTECYIVNM
jgi:hypothetical protein